MALLPPVQRLQALGQPGGGVGKVAAGVAVGHRVDVEIVQPGAMRLERRLPAAGERERMLEWGHVVRLTPWMWIWSAATRIPVSFSTV